jgi:DNA-binding GntR family transcriptional regulator
VCVTKQSKVAEARQPEASGEAPRRSIGPSGAPNGRAQPTRPSLRAVASDSTVDRVSRELRLAVVAGHLRPGETFSITQLCSELGVSHIPVREALRRLEGQGLVKFRHGRSGVVTEISVDDLDEIYHLRSLIETDLIKKAAARFTDDDIAVLRESLEAMETVADDPGGEAFWAAHHDFHWLLLEPTASSWSERVLLPLWHATERYTRLFYTERQSITRAMTEHRELLQAAERRSPKELSAVLRRHLDESHELLRKGAVDLEMLYAT